jgi:hypothetical protein
VATTFYAGQRVTAADLAGALPLLGWAKNDTSKTSSTTLSDATGLAVTLDASATYAIDAYLAYVAVEAADIKISLSAPVGSSGHWAMMCQPHAYVVTSGAAGLFQVRFAQATSSASPTLIKAGSWVRALRLA